MRQETRKLLDKWFTGIGFFSICLMIISLLIILTPIFYKGSKAFVFKGTIEFRKMNYEKFNRGESDKINLEIEKSDKLKAPLYEMMERFQNEVNNMSVKKKIKYKKELKELKKLMKKLLGPFPDERIPVLWRDQYGQTRWNRAKSYIKKIQLKEKWDYSDKNSMGEKTFFPRKQVFKNTYLEPFFDYFDKNIEDILNPKTTFYWRFILDSSHDAHFFGGIWPEILGTFYLTIGSMIVAIPFGIIAAIYLVEYAKPGLLVSFLRICISTLAGVPSIVFGLFGLAFFINTLKVSDSKSVLAGSLTLALLILPTIIRASEEAIRSVPISFQEAALSLGAGKWHTILTVVLPSSLPGILTGIVISMGRAAGETAPIIFTAAVSVGKPLKLLETFTQPTPALPWNIYNLCTEHEAAYEIRHVQFGMVFSLVVMVLLLNMAAIIIRAKISKKLKG